MPVLPVIVGAALTIGKMVNDQANQNKEQGIQANNMQYSPWTKAGADNFKPVTAPDQGSTAAAGALGTYQAVLDNAKTGKALETPITKGTQQFLDNPDNTSPYKLPEIGSSMKQASNPDLVHKMTEGDSPYSQTPYLSQAESNKAMGMSPQAAINGDATGGGGGPYRGYDENGNPLYWSGNYPTRTA